jgi:hypothetical protein
MIILKIHIADFALDLVDPKSHPPIPGDVQALNAFPATREEMCFPDRYVSQFARVLHGFRIADHLAQLVDAGCRQSLGIVLDVKAPESFMKKVAYLHARKCSL